MDLVNLLEKVENKETFIKFVKALAEDRRKAKKLENQNPEEFKFNCALEWYNTTIEDYLDSANSWLEDSGREDFSWKLMAEFLYCGKIYE